MNQSIALLVIRLITGILFFAQAYEKIFKVKLKNVVEVFGVQFGQKQTTKLPFSWGVYVSSYAELIGGALLILGLFRSVALYILAGDLLFVGLAFSMIKPMWDMQFYFPRIIFVAALLLLPQEWDRWCLDMLIR
jgi:putative oxidoreductase